MKTGTTEEWKKVVPKSRRKASPISKKTGPYPIILNKTGQKQKITVKQENIEIKKSQGPFAPKGKNLPNSTNATSAAARIQKTSTETESANTKYSKTHGSSGPKVPRVQQ